MRDLAASRVESPSRQTPCGGLPGRQLGQLLQLLLHMLLQLAGPQQDLADGADRGLAVKQRYCFLLTWPGKENRHLEQS